MERSGCTVFATQSVWREQTGGDSVVLMIPERKSGLHAIQIAARSIAGR